MMKQCKLGLQTPGTKLKKQLSLSLQIICGCWLRKYCIKSSTFCFLCWMKHCALIILMWQMLGSFESFSTLHAPAPAKRILIFNAELAALLLWLRDSGSSEVLSLSSAPVSGSGCVRIVSHTTHDLPNLILWTSSKPATSKPASPLRGCIWARGLEITRGVPYPATAWGAHIDIVVLLWWKGLFREHKDALHLAMLRAKQMRCKSSRHCLWHCCIVLRCSSYTMRHSHTMLCSRPDKFGRHLSAVTTVWIHKHSCLHLSLCNETCMQHFPG